MIYYTIYLLSEADQDIEELYDYIAYVLKEPVTALDYRDGIYYAIKKLAIYGGSLAISQRGYLRKHYGSTVRTVTYKKMAIIYSVIDNIILILRVMPGSLIL
jgi:plasmid stabilization system protein ParE